MNPLSRDRGTTAYFLAKVQICNTTEKVSAKVDLNQFAPSGCSNAIDYLIGTQYEYARNHLFHAKARKMVLPQELLHPEKIAAA